MFRRAMVLVTVFLFVVGCATSGKQAALTLETAQHPAWSLKGSPDELIVAVSPARRTFSMGGATTSLIGAGISAIANAKHRKAIEEVLAGYDAGAVFEEHLVQRLQTAMGSDFERVPPLGSTAGYSHRREAERARWTGLSRAGHDAVLDLTMTYGLFGYEGTLVAKLEAQLSALPGGESVSDESFVVSSEEILASDRLVDPTKRMLPDFGSPRLTVEEGAISQWTEDGGTTFRRRYEAAVKGAVSALLTRLGLMEEALGYYHLAEQSMNQKEFEQAGALFQKALALAPEMIEAKNGLAANAARMGDVNTAVALSEEILAAAPDYAPAHYNLAWWYAVEGGDIARAKPHYERALALGIAPEEKLVKAMGKGE